MNNLNQVIIEGNVVRQPEKFSYDGGFKVCTLCIAVNRKYKTLNGQFTEEVSYFDVDTYNNLAEICEKWCPTGRGIRVVGRIKQDRWLSEDGKNHSKVKIIAEHVEFKPFHKNIDPETGKVTETTDNTAKTQGPDSADYGNPAKSKKDKLAMLAEVAHAAQIEQEKGEEVAF